MADALLARARDEAEKAGIPWSGSLEKEFVKALPSATGAEGLAGLLADLPLASMLAEKMAQPAAAWCAHKAGHPQPETRPELHYTLWLRREDFTESRKAHFTRKLATLLQLPPAAISFTLFRGSIGVDAKIQLQSQRQLAAAVEACAPTRQHLCSTAVSSRRPLACLVADPGATHGNPGDAT